MKMEIELHVPMVMTVTEHLNGGASATYVVVMKKLIFDDDVMLDIELDIDYVLGHVLIRRASTPLKSASESTTDARRHPE